MDNASVRHRGNRKSRLTVPGVGLPLSLRSRLKTVSWTRILQPSYETGVEQVRGVVLTGRQIHPGHRGERPIQWGGGCRRP